MNTSRNSLLDIHSTPFSNTCTRNQIFNFLDMRRSKPSVCLLNQLREWMCQRSEISIFDYFIYQCLWAGSTLLIRFMEGEAEVKVDVAVNQKGKREARQPKEKRPRPERKNDYDYNADLIDENTVIPPLPKKSELIPKPDIAAYKARETKNKARIEEIIEKKKAIRAEKYKANRKNLGGEGNKHSEFQNEISEVQQLREKLGELKVERNALRDRLHKAIEEAKANNEKLKEFKGGLSGSRESFIEKLERLQHRLLTAEITKEEEKALNNEIMLLKRKVREAESTGNIEFKLEQCEERKEQLDEEIAAIKKEKDPIQAEYTRVKNELDKKNELITGLKGQIAAEKTEKTEEKERLDKEYEAWKEGKKVRLQKLEEQITRIRADRDKIWDEYNQKQEDYWKQKQLVDYIEWQTRIKNKKIANKERQARKAEYEKRDKEREKEDQLKKYLNEIELINFLINYLNNLRADNKTEEKKEVRPNPTELSAKLTQDSQWKKEKGLEIIQSKKSKEDEEPERKHKKAKKKQEAKQEEKFNIPFNVQTMFESLRLLAPTSSEGIDEKIKELREREELFLRVSREESNEEEKQLAEEIKNKQSKKETKKAAKKQEEEDFPTI